MEKRQLERQKPKKPAARSVIKNYKNATSGFKSMVRKKDKDMEY